MKSIKEIITEELQDYRGHHEAPGPGSDDSPMHDLTMTYGEDIYGPQALRLYGHHPYDQYSIMLMQQARNKPNMRVRIYRALPKVISNTEKISDYEKRMKYVLKTGRLPRDVDNFRNSSEYYDWLSDEIQKLKQQPANDDRVKINNGDWVTINPAYAKTHGQSNVGKFRVLTKTVSAKNLYNEGDVNEWGYSEALNESLGKEQNFNENFWKWFGKSAASDSKGRPLKLYHGTTSDFQEFKSVRGMYYFSVKPTYANQFAMNIHLRKNHGGDYTPSIMPVYLSIQKPLNISDLGNTEMLASDFIERLREKGVRLFYDDIQYFRHDRLKPWGWIGNNYHKILPAIKAEGFDGIIMYEDTAKPDLRGYGKNVESLVFAVFEPQQIKSASGNNGEFDSGNPDITKENLKEDISEFNKTKFSDVPQDLYIHFRQTRFSDDANRSHMKVFRAKDQRDFLIKKTINEDIFKVFDFNNLQSPIAVAIFDVHNDYFSGYEHRQSIEVQPKYRRIGIATALTDFAENIYNLPYKPTNLQSTDMQAFTKNRFGEDLQKSGDVDIEIVQRVADNLVVDPRHKNNTVLVNLNVRLADEAFQRDIGFYISPEDQGIGSRRDKVLELVKSGELQYAPQASIRMTNDGKPLLSFGDGRHRFAVLRDLGAETINISIWNQSKKYIPLLQGNNLSETVNNKKLYYHGRTANRPYRGKYIYISDNLGYAAGYSNAKELYTYSIPFDDDKIFSIKNPRHLQLLSKFVDKQSIDAVLRDSGNSEEMDWATINYLSTDRFEDPEDLIEHLGFLGIRLKERQDIDSLYIFDQSNLDFQGTIDITSPEYRDLIGKFHRDFAKDKNFL